jgi:uncharacterized BrkB/YihY/UPF0761 family membrane protein
VYFLTKEEVRAETKYAGIMSLVWMVLTLGMMVCTVGVGVMCYQTWFLKATDLPLGIFVGVNLLAVVVATGMLSTLVRSYSSYWRASKRNEALRAA